jgi:Chromosome segregation ATPases
MEQIYKKEIKNLQEKLQTLYKDQKELIYKYEANDKYWSQKCSKLEDTVLELTTENRDLQVKVAKLQAALSNQERDAEELNEKIADLKSKKDKKEDLVEKLQSRVGELLKENGEYSKELAIRLDEINKLRENLTAADGRIAELKAIIRENERNLTELHTKAIESSNLNLHRTEELQRRYDELLKNYEAKNEEMKRITDRNQELVDLVKEWEKKYDEKIHEITRQEHERTRLIEEDLVRRIEDMERNHKKEIARNEEKYKENMDLLEEEFKKVLLENNEKFKQLKAAFEEKCRSETELKQYIKLTVTKNTELEKIIEEQNEMLKKLRDEYAIALQEKEKLEKSVRKISLNVIFID